MSPSASMNEGSSVEKKKQRDLGENVDVIATLEQKKKEVNAHLEKNCLEIMIEANQEYVRKTSI